MLNSNVERDWTEMPNSKAFAEPDINIVRLAQMIIIKDDTKYLCAHNVPG